MTNILKDIWDDRQSGACWLPRSVFARGTLDLEQLEAWHTQPAFRDGLERAARRRPRAFAQRARVHVPDSEAGDGDSTVLLVGHRARRAHAAQDSPPPDVSLGQRGQGVAPHGQGHGADDESDADEQSSAAPDVRARGRRVAARARPLSPRRRAATCRRAPGESMSFDAPARSGGAATVAFIAALGARMRELAQAGAARSARGSSSQSGPGAARAAAAARARDRRRRDACSSRGGSPAGSLLTLAPGTVVAPRRVLAHGAEPVDVDAAWHAQLGCARRRVRARLRRSLERAGRARVARGQARRGRGDSRGCRRYGVGGDRGGSRRARACRSWRCASSSTASATRCPKAPNDGSTSAGDRRMAATLQAVVSWRQWRPLLTLAQRYRVASGVLDRLAHALAARRLLAVARCGAAGGELAAWPFLSASGSRRGRAPCSRARASRPSRRWRSARSRPTTRPAISASTPTRPT